MQNEREGDHGGRIKLVRRLTQWSREEVIVTWTKVMVVKMEKSE